MKYQKTVLMIAVLFSMVWIGCQEEQAQPTVDTSQVNRKVVDTYSDLAIQNAIIAQHTLYPYHFVSNSAQLNGLGHRDLSVLIRHFKDNSGKINVQQGDSDSMLYQSRIQTVSGAEPMLSVSGSRVATPAFEQKRSIRPNCFSAAWTRSAI